MLTPFFEKYATDTGATLDVTAFKAAYTALHNKQLGATLKNLLPVANLDGGCLLGLRARAVCAVSAACVFAPQQRTQLALSARDDRAGLLFPTTHHLITPHPSGQTNTSLSPAQCMSPTWL